MACCLLLCHVHNNHVLSCLLSDPAVLVISLLFQLRHLCPPRYPHICLPIYSPGVCSPVLFGCLTSGVTSCECYLCLPACLFSPLGWFLFILLLKDTHSPALESLPHLSSCNMTEPNSQMRTQRRMGSHRPPASNISSLLYQRILQFQALSLLRQHWREEVCPEVQWSSRGLGVQRCGPQWSLQYSRPQSPLQSPLQSGSPQSPLQSPLQSGSPQSPLQSGSPQSLLQSLPRPGRPEGQLQSLLRSGSPQSLLRSGSPQSPLQSLLRSGSPQSRSSQVVVLCSILVAYCAVSPALAPLSISVSRPSASTRAWPTIPPPDPPPAHPPS